MVQLTILTRVKDVLIVKSYIKGLVTGVISGAVLMSSVAVFAEDGIETIKALLRKDLAVTYNGTKVQLDNSAASIDGKTYLYLRDLGKVFDKNVNWNSKTNTVEISDKKVSQGTGSTGSKPITPESSKPVEQKPVEISPYESLLNKTLYNQEDVYYALRNKYYSIDYNKANIWSKVVNDQIIKTYNDIDYPAKSNTDYIYDRMNDKFYYTRDFYLQFLTSDDLENIKKYSVNSNGDILELK